VGMVSDLHLLAAPSPGRERVAFHLGQFSFSHFLLLPHTHTHTPSPPPDVDTHPSPQGCTYPPHVFQYYPIVPFFVPLRALTNKAVGNLLVAGKTIAQSFLANSVGRGAGEEGTEWR